MSGYFLSPSDKKRGLGKKLITTWEGRELVTWLFLKIYHPLSHEKPDKEGKCQLLIKTDKHLHFQNWIFLKIYHLLSQEELKKRKMPIEKTVTKKFRKERKCHLLKKREKHLHFQNWLQRRVSLLSPPPTSSYLL